METATFSSSATKQRTKLSIRHLPPALTEDEFHCLVAAWLPSINHLSFSPGSAQKDQYGGFIDTGSQTYGCAHVNFVDAQSCLPFQREFHRHEVVDSYGIRSIIHVDFAINQTLPRSDVQKNVKGGTLKETETYRQFLSLFPETDDTPNVAADRSAETSDDGKAHEVSVDASQRLDIRAFASPTFGELMPRHEKVVPPVKNTPLVSHLLKLKKVDRLEQAQHGKQKLKDENASKNTSKPAPKDKDRIKERRLKEQQQREAAQPSAKGADRGKKDGPQTKVSGPIQSSKPAPVKAASKTTISQNREPLAETRQPSETRPAVKILARKPQLPSGSNADSMPSTSNVGDVAYVPPESAPKSAAIKFKTAAPTQSITRTSEPVAKSAVIPPVALTPSAPAEKPPVIKYTPIVAETGESSAVAPRKKPKPPKSKQTKPAVANGNPRVPLPATGTASHHTGGLSEHEQKQPLETVPSIPSVASVKKRPELTKKSFKTAGSVKEFLNGQNMPTVVSYIETVIRPNAKCTPAEGTKLPQTGHKTPNAPDTNHPSVAPAAHTGGSSRAQHPKISKPPRVASTDIPKKFESRSSANTNDDKQQDATKPEASVAPRKIVYKSAVAKNAEPSAPK